MVPYKETDKNFLEKAYLPEADGMTVSIFKLAKNDEIFVTAMKLSGLRIYSVPKKCLLMAFRRQYANFITSCLEISQDCQNFYTSEFCYWQSGAASNRCLKKYSLDQQNLEEEDFVPITDANENIDHVCITKDSKYLFTIDSSNYLKKFSVENLLMKKSGISMLSNILKQASLNMIQNFGKLTFAGSLPYAKTVIGKMMISDDGTWMFVTSKAGQMKQFWIDDRFRDAAVRDSGVSLVNSTNPFMELQPSQVLNQNNININTINVNNGESGFDKKIFDGVKSEILNMVGVG
jgi:hypothetical protein